MQPFPRGQRSHTRDDSGSALIFAMLAIIVLLGAMALTVSATGRDLRALQRLADGAAAARDYPAAAEAAATAMITNVLTMEHVPSSWPSPAMPADDQCGPMCWRAESITQASGADIAGVYAHSKEEEQRVLWTADIFWANCVRAPTTTRGAALAGGSPPPHGCSAGRFSAVFAAAPGPLNYLLALPEAGSDSIAFGGDPAVLQSGSQADIYELPQDSHADHVRGPVLIHKHWWEVCGAAVFYGVVHLYPPAPKPDDPSLPPMPTTTTTPSTSTTTPSIPTTTPSSTTTPSTSTTTSTTTVPAPHCPGSAALKPSDQAGEYVKLDKGVLSDPEDGDIRQGPLIWIPPSMPNCGASPPVRGWLDRAYRLGRMMDADTDAGPAGDGKFTPTIHYGDGNTTVQIASDGIEGPTTIAVCGDLTVELYESSVVTDYCASTNNVLTGTGWAIGSADKGNVLALIASGDIIVDAPDVSACWYQETSKQLAPINYLDPCGNIETAHLSPASVAWINVAVFAPHGRLRASDTVLAYNYTMGVANQDPPVFVLCGAVSAKERGQVGYLAASGGHISGWQKSWSYPKDFHLSDPPWWPGRKPGAWHIETITVIE